MSTESSYEIGKETLVQDIAGRVIAALGDPLKASPEMWDAIMEAIPYIPYRYSYFVGSSPYPLRIDVVMNNRNYLDIELRAPNNTLLMELRIHP